MSLSKKRVNEALKSIKEQLRNLSDISAIEKFYKYCEECKIPNMGNAIQQFNSLLGEIDEYAEKIIEVQPLPQKIDLDKKIITICNSIALNEKKDDFEHKVKIIAYSRMCYKITNRIKWQVALSLGLIDKQSIFESEKQLSLRDTRLSSKLKSIQDYHNILINLLYPIEPSNNSTSTTTAKTPNIVKKVKDWEEISVDAAVWGGLISILSAVLAAIIAPTLKENTLYLLIEIAPTTIFTLVNLIKARKYNKEYGYCNQDLNRVEKWLVGSNSLETAKNEVVSKIETTEKTIVAKVEEIKKDIIEEIKREPKPLKHNNTQPSIITTKTQDVYHDNTIHTTNDGYEFKISSDGENNIYYLVGYIGDETNLTLPEVVKGHNYIIDKGAFEENEDIIQVTIPDSVTTIGESAFYCCDFLTSVTIGNSVTTIGDDAFFSCDSLTSVTIGNSVTTIGDDAFFGCESLTSINVSENNVNFKSIDGNLYSKDGTTLIQYAMGKENTSFVIPDSVTTIGDKAFYECCLTSVTIGNSVTTIGDEAFFGCYTLTSVTIGNSVTTIGEHAFNYCYDLSEVYYGGDETSWNNIHIDRGNEYLSNATRYYYSESKPTTSGNYWHYVNGVATKWGA